MSVAPSDRRRGHLGVTPFVLLVLSAAGCDRCAGTKDTKTPATPDASSVTGPIIIAPDGGRIVAAAALTEQMVAMNAGPMAKGKASTPMTIECTNAGQPVSPTIFGVGWADADKELGATAHRWGGNWTSRYNWKIHARNSGNDWFYRNVEVDSTDVFLGKVEQRGGRAAVTVPMIGWVAKDATSASYPVSVYGPQEKQEEGFGNGKKVDGKTWIMADPARANVTVGPADVGAWVAELKARDAKTGRRVVYEYILDNEPGLWSTTHHDVHPDPMTYDELLEKTIAFGTAIRKADPDAVIAGPAPYGWWEYFWSAKDHDAMGFPRNAPDRRAHGNEPLLAWYLKKLAEHEKKTGGRILDVLDVHLYPQANGVQGPDNEGGDGGGGTDRPTNELRYRTTRSLWDREYKDESWIDDNVYLIPRMKDLIAQSYPGRGFQIGEYNFGAEHHVAGALALAEVLGRFAMLGVSHAYYWTFPKKPKPAYWAFRAYTNYDGNGGRFLDRIVPTTAPSGTSIYASRDEAGKKWVVVLLQFSADRPFDASVELKGCAQPSSVKSYVYTGGPGGFTNGDVKVDGGKLRAKLPPSSIHVVELQVP